MTQTEALKLALEALEWATSCMSFDDFDDMPEALEELNKAHEAITAIKEALAQPEHHTLTSRVNDVRFHKERDEQRDEAMKMLSQPEQEPVTWMHPDGRLWTFGRGFDKSTFTIPLYTTPPQRKPLTDEQYEAIIEDLAEWSRYVEVDTAHQSLEKHVRQVLAAHGIKE